MTQVLINEVTMQLKCLPDAMQQQVLTFIQSLQQRLLRGTPARKLLKCGKKRADQRWLDNSG